MPIFSKRKRKFRGFASKTGLAPGTMFFLGERKQDKVRIDVIDYSETSLEEVCDVRVDQCLNFASTSGVTWINVNGIHDVELIETLGKLFGLHPLTLEDIVNTIQRPKTEEFPSYMFVVLKMMAFNEAEKKSRSNMSV